VRARAGDPHVAVVKKRRNLTDAFKRRVVAKLNELRTEGFGAVGGYLRRVGVYYSTAKIWERQVRDGVLGSSRGRREQGREALLRENKRLRRQLERTERLLHQSELIIDLQKKISDVAASSLCASIGRSR
jgi:transposase-like protein